jgi:hypothetical protein
MIPRCPQGLEAVEDQLEAELELGGQVVAAGGDVRADHLGAVGECLMVEAAQHPLGHLGADLRAVEGRERPLLQREAVDEAVLERVGAGGVLDREARLAQAAQHRFVQRVARRARVGPSLHQPVRPRVAAQRLAGRGRAPPLRGAPLDAGLRRLDLLEDEVEQPVDQIVLARHVVVERHRLDADLLGELAHAEPLDAVGVGQFERGVQHFLAVEWSALDRHTP